LIQVFRHSQEEAMTTLHKTRATIIVVDDERDLLNMVARFLSNAGYNVIEVENPEEALSICSRLDSRVDLLLSDYRMPGMSGMQLGMTLRTVRPNLPMLFMSGNCEAEELLVANGFRCLRKPFILTDLADLIHEILEAH
jgi:DNA-binding NtrC family response regulator